MRNSKLLLFIFFNLIVTIINAQRFEKCPSWVQDLVVYELSPKTYTSPQGPGTGTFNSLKEKIPYLRDLGINAVWMSGHSWSDNQHFYNIWTQYACIRPDSIDASLGTSEDLKKLVTEFHNNGIKVFLDIITHGVMNYSPLISEKPHWFKGGSWGMTDYDWYGGHADLDEWWVNTHVKYVLEYGIDGFRLDVEMPRPDLWQRIKDEVARKGHPIAICLENPHLYTNNVPDFYQTSNRIMPITCSNIKDFNIRGSLLHDVATYYQNYIYNRNNNKITKVDVYYADNTKDSWTDTGDGNLTLKTDLLSQKKLKLKINGINKCKQIKRIEISSSLYNNKYVLTANDSPGNFQLALTDLSEINLILDYFPADRIYLSNELSSHDRGWEGFDLYKNPYLVQRSRCILGYSSLLTPSIPIFMAGEEFNAQFVPLPWLSPYLFKKENIGKGRWLYGSWLQWDQLNQLENQDFLMDVKKILSIRTQERDVIHSFYSDLVPNILALEYKADAELPVPYIIWNEKKAVIIIGNNTDNDVEVQIKIPFKKIGMESLDSVRISDLWNGGCWTIKTEETTYFSCIVKKDKISGGGLAIYKLEK